MHLLFFQQPNKTNLTTLIYMRINLPKSLHLLIPRNMQQIAPTPNPILHNHLKPINKLYIPRYLHISIYIIYIDHIEYLIRVRIQYVDPYIIA